MDGSDIVEVAEDHTKMRSKVNPTQWPLDSQSVMAFSNLKVDVPEFVPGQKFQYVPQVTGMFLASAFSYMYM